MGVDVDAVIARSGDADLEMNRWLGIPNSTDGNTKVLQPGTLAYHTLRAVTAFCQSGDAHLTVYDILDCRTLLVSQDALSKLEERLVP